MGIDSSPPQAFDSVDPAQSLRAAALLSRKRRKVAVEQAPTLSQRPPVEQILQLDYGQEESFTSSALFPSTHKKLSSSSGQPPSPTPEIEDGQIREEGEISDTEEAAHLHTQRPTSPPPKFRRLETSSKDTITSKPIVTSPADSHSKPSTRLDSPFLSSRPAPESEHFQHPPQSFSHPFVLETFTYRLDADHVRPGLAMTQAQYNTAKDSVLDLLGWGVPPEYLVDCGLSRHVVFYVFTELNLRMPTNLDIDGLIPYPTPEMISIPASPSQSVRSHISASSTMPPPSTIPSHKEFASPITTHASDPSGSRLVARLGLRIPSALDFTDVKVEPTSPSAAGSISSQSLHMIEQQRRQELLARKAVFASRKAKLSNSPGAPSSIRDRDVETAPVAPTETVDDFLKSIPAVDTEGADNRNIPTSFGAVGHYVNPDAMEVDEVFPTLITPQSASSGPSGQTSFHSGESETSAAGDNTSPTTDAPPWSGNSTVLSSDTSGAPSSMSMAGDSMSISNSTSPTFASTIPAYDTNALQRRGTKRPVAADFVDFDHGPGTSRVPSGNGYLSNGYIQPIPLLRRKTGSFAGVSGIRRCVIDLSDSEDDGDDNGMGDSLLYDGPSSYSPMIMSTRPPRLGASGMPIASHNFANGEGRSTPPNPHVSNGNASLGMSPAVLAEKEEEIKQMRQMIARREELRHKKLAAMSGKPTLTTQLVAPGASTTDVVVASVETLSVASESGSRVSIKQEDSAIPFHNVPVGNIQSLEHAAWVYSGGAGFRPITNEGSVDEDQVLTLTEEARLEPWVSPSATAHETAGVFDVPLASRVPKKESQDIEKGFASYDSPFSSHPLLLSQLRLVSLDVDSSQDPRGTASHSLRLSRRNARSAPDLSSSSSSASLIYCAPSLSHSSCTVFVPDLKPLKLATMQRALGQMMACNSGLRVCQYEVPGGGACRDDDCNDLHLSRLASEPSDTDLAAYVHGVLPEPWRSRCDVRALEIALERVRLGGSGRNVDDRVTGALGGLGIPVTPSSIVS